MFEFTSLGVYKLLFTLELLVSELIYTFRLKRRNKFILRLIVGITVCFALTFFFPVPMYNAMYSSLMFLFLFGVSLIMLYMCYDEPLVNVIFCGIAAYTTRHFAFQIYSLVSSAGNAAIGAFSGRGPENPLADLYGGSIVGTETFGLGTVFWGLIYVDIYVVCYSVIFAFFGRQLWRNDDLKINNTSLLVLVGIVLFIDILLNAVLVYITDDYNAAYTVIMYAYNTLCCVLTLYMQYSMISMKKLKKELSVVNRMWQQEREQYEITKENIDLINLKCHDLKHQIRQIGRHQSIRSEAVEEIESLISIYGSVVKTGNEALDVILTEKSLICQKKSISLTCMADGARLGFMDEADIYSLFGNIVDNAMDAVVKIPDAERRIIGLSVRAADNMLAVNVNNYYEGVIVMDGEGLPITTKRNKDYHGFGMKSVRLLVEKYGGDLTITADDGVFNVNIVFPTTKRRSKEDFD